MTRSEFIKTYKGWAIESTFGTGIFPSVKMAQAIIESSNRNGVPGASSLASKHNNFFGIKANSGWKGKRVNLATGEVFNGNAVIINDDFRVYDSPRDSFFDHTKFLVENSRYAKAGVFTASTPDEQAHRLKAAGYATAPDYANAIISVINANNLRQLDKKKV